MWGWSSLSILLFVAHSVPDVSAQGGGDTCEINGEIFQRGESLGESFTTRCGASSNYPCFCNPDVTPHQVECPYCGFALEGGGLLCAKDGEVHSFTDVDGNAKTCDCTAPLGGPSPTYNCDTVVGGAADENPEQPEQGSNTGSCIFDLPDGTTVTFSGGEPISNDLFPNRCGDSFPCFCDPSADNQMSCPYCRFAGMAGDLFCARNGQVVAFQDEQGKNQMCSCTIGDNGQTSSSCNASDDGGETVPTLAPTTTIMGPPTDQQLDVCTLQVEDSDQIITFRNGESYGEYLSTRCGNSTAFPCYCNTALPNQVDCPYCGFVRSDDGELECARDGETIGFLDGSSYRSCSCQIPYVGAEPVRSCSDGDIPPTMAPTDVIVQGPGGNTNNNVCATTGRNGEIVVVQNGESFGDLIEAGVCGSTQDWPAFCNLGLSSSSGTISRQNEDSFVEYPYCIFENTESGTPVCAKSDSQITYMDDTGVQQRCSCVYLDPSLGGAQATCTPLSGDASSPTGAPPIVITPTTTPSSSAQTRASVAAFITTVVMISALFV